MADVTIQDGLAEIKHIIGVASGKGGVGKSTTAVNLALALAANGAKVGILDADIYGPSVPMMLGLPDGTRPQVEEEKYFLPVPAHGIVSMSMGYLVTEQTPMVWRGPMATGALMQMLNQTRWGALDYLVVDMPPGTGDIQLTLAQKASMAGAVIVTTPQDIALLDARKAIEMFSKVKIPVLGIVENMAMHRCSQCGHEEPIFGEGGGQRVAEQYHTEVLGSLPLDRLIREQVDGGTPSVIAEPEGSAAQRYGEIAARIAVLLAEIGSSGGPQITIE
jgi:ATP-binding protein involved in chromosome partitioning